jgi:hypothetical protein
MSKSNQNEADVHSWIMANCSNGVFAVEYAWCPDNGITIDYNIGLYNIMCETLPYKFNQTLDLHIHNSKLNNFNNFPNVVLGNLVIKNCDITSIVGLENVDVAGCIYLLDNRRLEYFDDEINSVILNYDIITDVNNFSRIKTSKNVFFVDSVTLLRLQRRLKLKQITDE